MAETRGWTSSSLLTSARSSIGVSCSKSHVRLCGKHELSLGKTVLRIFWPPIPRRRGSKGASLRRIVRTGESLLRALLGGHSNVFIGVPLLLYR